MELSESERMAINEFLAWNWGKFEAIAAQYLSPEEVAELGNKLAG